MDKQMTCTRCGKLAFALTEPKETDDGLTKIGTCWVRCAGTCQDHTQEVNGEIRYHQDRPPAARRARLLSLEEMERSLIWDGKKRL